jgi:hypothetical protein
MNHNAKWPQASSPETSNTAVSAITFALFIFFLVDFFLHLSARIPGYSALRPTLLLVIAISFSLILQRERVFGWTNDPLVKSVLVLIGYILVSLPLVEWPGSVVKNNFDGFVKAIVFFFFSALIIDSPKRLKIFLWVFVGCQVFRVLEPLYLHFTQGYWGSATYMGHGEFAQRLSGAPSDVINPNELGFVIATAVPFLHYLLWPASKKAKCLYLALLPPLLYALILTQSRGALLALLVVAFFVFKQSSRKFMLILLAMAIAVASWQVMNPEQRDRYLSLVGDSHTKNAASAEGRLEGMLREFKIGLERPVVGHGLGTTPEAKTHIIGSRQASHNLYAELLIELGGVGTMIFFAYMAQIYKKLRMIGRFTFSDLDPDAARFYRNLRYALTAVFWMYAVYSINYWGLSQYYWYLFGGLVLVFSKLSLAAVASNVDNSVPAEVTEKFPLASQLRSNSQHPKFTRR